MAELIDILTPEGELTGEVLSKNDAHRLGLWHHTVHLWVTVNRREVLLQKRSKTKVNHPGLWDISCAGHIAAGETPARAGVRELEEELGIPSQPDSLEFLYKQSHQWILNNGSYIDNEWNHVYLLDINSPPEVRLRDGEVDKAKLVHWRELKKAVDRRDPSFVSHWESYEQLFPFLNG